MSQTHLKFRGQSHPWSHRIVWLIASIGGPTASYNLLSTGKWVGGILFGLLSIPAIFVLGWASTIEWNEESISIRETQFGIERKKMVHLWPSILSIKMRKITEHRVPRYEFEFIDVNGNSVFENPVHTDGMIGLKDALFDIAKHHKISIVDVSSES